MADIDRIVGIGIGASEKDARQTALAELKKRIGGEEVPPTFGSPVLVIEDGKVRGVRVLAWTLTA